MKRNFEKDWKLLTAPFRMLPDFIIPGEAKCGTTSLYRYMAEHPDIVAADEKEPRNFMEFGASPNFCRQHYPFAFKKAIGGPLLTGEASANYFAHPTAPRDIKAVIPNVKIILLFRDPVTRVFSDYQMMVKNGTENQPFEEGVEDGLKWLTDPKLERLVKLAEKADHGFIRYILRGVYVRNVLRWWELFPKENFLFLKSEDFFEKPQEVLDQVFRFLGLKEFSLGDFPVLKKGGYDAKMNPATREKLTAFFQPHNQKLYEVLGRDFGW